MYHPLRGFVLLIVFAIVASGVPAQSTPAPRKRSWAEEKCLRYRKGWDEALRRLGRTGLGSDFLARHDAFLASGCTGVHDVCARSAEELKMADTMVVVAMNAGTASTFPPFACPK